MWGILFQNIGIPGNKYYVQDKLLLVKIESKWDGNSRDPKTTNLRLAANMEMEEVRKSKYRLPWDVGTVIWIDVKFDIHCKWVPKFFMVWPLITFQDPNFCTFETKSISRYLKAGSPLWIFYAAWSKWSQSFVQN